MAYTTGTLTGTYKTFDDQPASGVVEIIPNSRSLVDAEGDVILAGRVKVTLDETGSFTVTLPATDDETVEPATGRQYTVVAKLRHTHLPAVTGVELTTGETVDVADVASQPVVDAAVTPAATVEQLAALEATTTEALATKQNSASLDADAAALVTSGGATDAALSATYVAGLILTGNGIDPTGATDSAAAIQAALNGAAATTSEAYLPEGTYLLGAGITIPSGMSLRMGHGHAYTGAPTRGAQLVATNTAITGALVTLGSGAALRGGAIVGAGKSTAAHDGIKLGGNNTIEHVTVTYCQDGIDGNYTSVNKIVGVMVHDCGNIGLRDIVDSQVLGGYFNVCAGAGIGLNAGANDNAIIGTKVEWNEGYGFLVASTTDNTISSCVVDRNGKSGFRCTSNSRLTISGAQVRRNGSLSSATASDDNHFYLQSNTDLTIIGAQTQSGANDDATGYTSPLNTIREQSNTRLKIVASNLSGCTGTVRNTVAANTGTTIATSEGTGTNQYVGTGSPEGVLTAQVGSTYVDTAATNGAVEWVKASGDGTNAGWRVTKGDTGWRQVVAAGAIVTMPMLRVAVRRVNDMVQFATIEPSGTIGTASGLVNLWTIPVGFQPQAPAMGGNASFLASFVCDSGARPLNSALYTLGTGTLSISAVNGARHYGTLVLTTSDPWPTSLPGSAA